MGYCAAVNCKNSDKKGCRMFRFTKDPKRRKQWAINCGRGNWNPGQNSQLCGVHFDENQFELHRQDGLKKLKQNAIPTVFPQLEQPPRKKRKKRTPSFVVEDEPEPKKKKLRCTRASTLKGQTSPKGNASHYHRKGAPQIISLCHLKEDSDSESEEEETEQEKQIAHLKRENESMRQEIQEFEKHNKTMSNVILELNKHNELISKRLQVLEKQNEYLREKLNCCFSEEQFAKMEKLVALGKIERYIPEIK